MTIVAVVVEVVVVSHTPALLSTCETRAAVREELRGSLRLRGMSSRCFILGSLRRQGNGRRV
ncbi:hypothetical protein E2C01_036394 [Portunus trituberculatus]|uniref:Uncharacterized protein n=1 Tax=Portunus trituberculatus TaxID=210409 RepID=A0A5B7F8L6_PORTR|nr:hypothetical protein [Portunus trituberculatus]